MEQLNDNQQRMYFYLKHKGRIEYHKDYIKYCKTKIEYYKDELKESKEILIKSEKSLKKNTNTYTIDNLSTEEAEEVIQLINSEPSLSNAFRELITENS